MCFAVGKRQNKGEPRAKAGTARGRADGFSVEVDYFHFHGNRNSRLKQ